jgi:hypothetical protein
LGTTFRPKEHGTAAVLSARWMHLNEARVCTPDDEDGAEEDVGGARRAGLRAFRRHVGL